MVTPWSAGAALLDAGRASLVFSYLSQDTDTELLANPRVVTTDNVKARISIATQFPIPNFAFSEQTASLQINGFEYKDIGIILNVLPRINKDDFITLEVAPEASSSTENATLQSGGGSAVLIPIINTRTATTTVLIKSGNTLAIGGLMRQDISDNYTKVPLMGDAPLIGALFRSKSLTKTKRDLLIFLTPTIVRGDSQTTGYEKYADGLPNKQVYTDDKWMPKDNAKRRPAFGLFGTPSDSSSPPQNFGPK
jgi:type II secretory pathway component GspD/PulD (secretin)